MSAGEAGPDPARIRAMFGSIARRYDRANTVLSLGTHRRWRRRLVEWSAARPGMSVLDCATGTGDLAIAFKRAVGETGTVVGVDFCADMLAMARQKSRRRGLQIVFETADVTSLPCAAGRFDVSGIAFGIRNVQDPVRALVEMSRVTRPGGTVVVLEFGQVAVPVFRAVYGLYARHVLPRLGGLLTGDRRAYRYLEQSSAAFPCRADFLALMQATGRLADLAFRPLAGGVAYLYRGRVVQD